MAKAGKEVQRLDKVVSHLTGMSRSNVSKLIKNGDVTVDDEVITDSAAKICVHSVIVIAGFNDALPDDEGDVELVRASDAFKKRVFLLNKPYNYVCADRDKNHAIVTSLFRNELNLEKLHSAGRLDIDTTGLLIVTDDGDLNHEITSPKKEVSKVYLARLDKAVPESAIKAFASGIKHPEEKKRYQAATLTLLDTSDLDCAGEHWAAVQLTEGRYHEVKRLFEVVGCQVQDLVRVAVGSLTLPSELNLGDYVALDVEDQKKLFEKSEFSVEELVNLLKEYKSSLERSKVIFQPDSFKFNKQGAAASDTDALSSAAISSTQDAHQTHLDTKEDFEDAEVFDDDEVFEDEAGDFDDLDENGDLRIY